MQNKKGVFMSSKKTNKADAELCCSSGCCCGGEDVYDKESKRCPLCSKKGASVKLETVKSIIKKNKKVSMKENFYLCENPDCDAVYFSDRSVFYKKDLKIDIDFKKDAETKYACYCNKLTYDEVKKIVKKYKKTDWAFVVKMAKGKINKCDCLHKNPYGSCCTSNSFKKAVEETGFKFKGECL